MKWHHWFQSEMKASGGRFDTKSYDPESQIAVIRSSICTGKKDGHFTEVMLIRSARDEERFKELYHVDSLKTEY